MINTKDLTLFESPYPFLIANSFLSQANIDSLNSEHQQLFNSDIETWDGGQESRENIVITRDNCFLQKHSQSVNVIADLFNSLDSREFRNYLYNIMRKHLHPNAFIGKQIDAFMNSTLEMQLCRSIDGYENPIHVDTRKRVVHALIYLQHSNLSGGEFDIVACSKKLLSWDYSQFPATAEVENIYRFAPSNNRSIFILSTPNSYHRGVASKGTRNFLYIGYNYSDIAWKIHSSWHNPKSFTSALDAQKLSESEHPLPKCQPMTLSKGKLIPQNDYKQIKPVRSQLIGTDSTLLRGLASS